jgi:hypothetical protein
MVSLLAGAAVMGTTFAVPFQAYKSATGAAPAPGDVLARYVGAVPDHLRVSGAQSALYAALTPALALAYLAAPGYTLYSAFGCAAATQSRSSNCGAPARLKTRADPAAGALLLPLILSPGAARRYVKDAASYFLWQAAGSGLLALGPALTYSLKKQADEGRLGEAVSKTLNGGLLVFSLAHVSVLYPMYMAGQGGTALPWLLGAWATGAATGALEMFSGGSTAEIGRRL